MRDKVQKIREVIEKELLLQDLCARLPYGVKVQVYDSRYAPTTLTAIDIRKQECIFNFNVPVENCLPYLRPMSSMTEEEKKEYRRVCELDTEILANHPMNGEPFPALYNSQNWLNAHHFDYRGLIEKGLALEALEGMYN